LRINTWKNLKTGSFAVQDENDCPPRHALLQEAIKFKGRNNSTKRGRIEIMLNPWLSQF
jgi:hypothetical protein